jgi:uncharacterized peroxidase-related enzyme
MAYISTIPDSEASAPLKALYERCRDPEHGVVPNILRIHSHNPSSLEAHVRYYQTVVRGRSPLSRAQREMIAVVVSATNHCRY